MKNCLGRATVAALLRLGAARLDAQITTVVAAPPKRNAPSQQVVAQREQAAQDSIARVTMTGMKEWVDSAATALAIRPDTVPTAADTSVNAARPVAPAPRADSANAARPSQQTPKFKDGARPPDTATAVPTLALAGAALIAFGVAMNLRPRRVRARARR